MENFKNHSIKYLIMFIVLGVFSAFTLIEKDNTSIKTDRNETIAAGLEGNPGLSISRKPSEASIERPPYCGIWGIWGGERVSSVGRPWFKGVVTTTGWNSIEPANGQFDWSTFDSLVYNITGKGLNVMLMIYHGNQVPEWVFTEAGVPKAIEGSGRRGSEPYYLHPNYKPLLTRMINETAKHVSSYPPEIRKYIIGVQCPTGKSGDPQPYSGVPENNEYVIELYSPEWIQWTIDIIQVYNNAYKNLKPSIFMLFKGPNPMTNEWLVKNIPDSWRKPHSIAQGYQFNDEIHNMNETYPRTSRYVDGIVIRTRGELDNTEYGRSNWFNAAPVWNVYWSGLWNLTYGLDIWSHLPRVLEDERHIPAFTFYTKYAGYKIASESPGAWVALRDGLDCIDTLRFPVKSYGPLEPLKKDKFLESYISSNKERYLKIAKDFAEFGAVMDDSVNFNMINLDVRRMRGMNDVGASIWRDNYGMYLNQVDANKTSQGYWRVGSKEQPFGRFARGIDGKNGEAGMYFNLDDAFFETKAPHKLSIRVVYFDKGNGTWSLKYDAMDNPAKTARTISNTNTNEWKEILISISDARLQNRGIKSTDVSLVYEKGEGTLFHMIEILR
jgi:hypothetical protein